MCGATQATSVQINGTVATIKDGAKGNQSTFKVDLATREVLSREGLVTNPGVELWYRKGVEVDHVRGMMTVDEFVEVPFDLFPDVRRIIEAHDARAIAA